MNLRAFILIFVLLMAFIGYAKHKDQLKRDASTSHVTKSVEVSTQSPAVIQPKGEPSEEELRKLEFKGYEELEKSSLAMPIQTSEKQAVAIPLKLKLYEVHKDKCVLVGDDWYECDLTIKLSYNGGAPGIQGDRIRVKWDSKKGEWVTH